MFKLLSIILFAFFTIPCLGQNLNLSWQISDLKEIGVKANLPCPPRKYPQLSVESKSSQIKYFTCEIKGIRFLISAENISQNNYKQAFEVEESLWQSERFFGRSKIFVKKDQDLNGLQGKLYDVEYESGKVIKSLIVINKKYIYLFTIATLPPFNDYRKNKIEEISKKFIDSFEFPDK